MAERATASTSTELKCSASKVFRVYMEKLMEAIQSADIPMVTMKLYSKEVISENTRDKVLLPNLTKLEKNGILLTAVEDAIKTQPQVLLTLLDVLNEFKPADLIAQEMRPKLDHSVPLEMYCETCDELFCQYCSTTDHEAHQYGLVADVFPEHKKELERELVEVKEELSILTTAQQAMKDRIDQILVQGKEVEQQIHTATQQAIKLLQESEKRMIEMTRKEVQRNSLVVSGQIEEVDSKCQQLLAFQKFVEEEVIAASPQQILTVKHQKVEHVRSVKSKVSSSNLQLIEAASIVFTADKDLLSCCSKLGKVYNLDDIQRKGKEITMVCETSTFELTSSLPQNLDALSCQLTAPGSSEPVECTITPTQSGGCSISYTPAVRGPHQMRITVGGTCTDISNSPFTIHVYPTPEMRGKQIGTITGVTKPQGVAVSKSGEVVVSGCDNHITVFNRDGSKKRTFGSAGSDKGQFQQPMGIALTQADNYLLVADTENHRVQMLTLEGKLIKSVGQEGKGQLQFSFPIGIAVHPISGQVFIVDTHNNRIQVLNNDLTYSHMFRNKGSGNGQFNEPHGIACDSSGDIYVVDCKNGRIQVFTPSGNFISLFTSSEFWWYPSGIAIDIMNTVYVGGSRNVTMFNSNRQFIRKFAGESDKYSFSKAYNHFGLAVKNTGDLLYCGYKNVAIY